MEYGKLYRRTVQFGVLGRPETNIKASTTHQVDQNISKSLRLGGGTIIVKKYCNKSFVLGA